MKDLIQNAKAVEARLRDAISHPMLMINSVETITSLCTALESTHIQSELRRVNLLDCMKELEAAQKDAEQLWDECDQITEMNHAQWLALENCKSIAVKNRKEEWSQHILRFCADGGVVPNPLRFSIKLNKAEIQSGVSRVRWAEGLIRQLPEDHDGRNSWLLNYSDAAIKAQGDAK